MASRRSACWALGLVIFSGLGEQNRSAPTFSGSFTRSWGKPFGRAVMKPNRITSCSDVILASYPRSWPWVICNKFYLSLVKITIFLFLLRNVWLLSRSDFWSRNREWFPTRLRKLFRVEVMRPQAGRWIESIASLEHCQKFGEWE